jgi:hypothetical protein
MSDANAVGSKPQPKSAFNGCLVAIVLGIGFFLLCGVFLGPINGGGEQRGKHNAAMQQSRQIGQLMYSYATDHDGRYPEGNSSTEIFQKLINDGYATDPEIFYVALLGKVKAIAGKKLRPENVCWDVTSGVDSQSSDFVPFVFMTGYRIKYASGESAVPVIKPYPPYWCEPRTWSQWWNENVPTPDMGPSGIAVFYKGNNAVFLKLDADNTAPNVVSPDYKPDGHTYRQLTPDGELK